MAHILVTGGAGYVGSHTVKLLAAGGEDVVTCDNLSSGSRDAVKAGEFVKADIRDSEAIQEAIRKYGVDRIVHFAACVSVAESIEDPASYYENNVCGTLSLLRAALKEGVKKLVFSSSATT